MGLTSPFVLLKERRIKDGSNVDAMSLIDFTYESELPNNPSLPQYNPNINISPGGYNLP